MTGQLMKCCEYCGGPDHAIGLCRAVAAVEYRNGDVVKRVEFNRDMEKADWFDVRAGVMSAESTSV